MDLFSLDLVILVIVTCNCFPFSYSRSIFRRHISWEMPKITFRSLQIWKFSGGRYPHTPAQASCLLHSPFGRSQIVPWRNQQFGKNIYRIFGRHHIFKEMSFSADYEISNKLLITIQIQYLCLTTQLLRLPNPHPPPSHLAISVFAKVQIVSPKRRFAYALLLYSLAFRSWSLQFTFIPSV